MLLSSLKRGWPLHGALPPRLQIFLHGGNYLPNEHMSPPLSIESSTTAASAITRCDDDVATSLPCHRAWTQSQHARLNSIFYLPWWAGALVQWLNLPAWKAVDRKLESHSGLRVSKKQNVFPAHSWRFNIVGNLCDQEVACSASNLQGLNFGSCISLISPSSGGFPGPI